MALKSQIIILPPSAVFDTQSLPPFDNFSAEDSALLYSTLYANHIDVIKRQNGTYEITCLFDRKDEQFIPAEIKDTVECRYFEVGEKWKLLASVSQQKTGTDNSNILVLLSNTIGITPASLQYLFNLLNNDDNNIITGSSLNGTVAFFGYNFFDPALFGSLGPGSISSDDFLRAANKANGFIFSLKGYHSVGDLEDFRKLYRMLSTKDSIDYCSQSIHEQFTQLFIEYKELL